MGRNWSRGGAENQNINKLKAHDPAGLPLRSDTSRHSRAVFPRKLVWCRRQRAVGREFNSVPAVENDTQLRWSGFDTVCVVTVSRH